LPIDVQLADILTIGMLVLLEGLLSADNALVLAILVLGLPREQQARALKYGIVGAFVFCIIAILLASVLMQVAWVKLVGGLYLAYLAWAHFAGKDGQGNHVFAISYIYARRHPAVLDDDAPKLPPVHRAAVGRGLGGWREGLGAGIEAWGSRAWWGSGLEGAGLRAWGSRAWGPGGRGLASRVARSCAVGVALCGALAGCSGGDAQPAASATPIYNAQTGRLDELRSDRDGDGTVDTRAFMDGTRIVRIEIDRDNDGRVDRREYYTAGTGQQSVIERAEETSGVDDVVRRREFYVGGVRERVEEDTSLDGQADKWEFYLAGRLVRVDLDLAGRGKATRRLHYGTDGSVDRVEGDPDGDGVFAPVVPATGGSR